MRVTEFLRERLLDLLPGEIAANEAIWLISPRLHMPLMEQRRAQMIGNRVRLFALLFAALTPLWIIVDVLTLPDSLWLQLAALRLLTTVAFGALVRWRPRDGHLASAHRRMALLFLIPTLFYLVSHFLLVHYHLHGVSAAIGTGYAFLPFVLVAGFAVFPLTLLENIVFASPVLVACALAIVFNWPEVSWPSFGGQFWLLSLLSGVVSLASMSQLAFIIALVNQAIRDPLTGAFSRRSGEEMLDMQLSIARRHNLPFTVAFFDIDHFKTINDQFGHEAGDRVLRQFIQRLAQQLRCGDMLVRWGGEEFLLLMSNADAQQASRALERLRKGGLGTRPDGSPLTVSVGLAERIADHANEPKLLVEKADARMYLAKHQGRDRVVCAA
jgi:diguanylate cyclase (GGDEF)-like protein